MGLQAALVDRARVVAPQASGTKVEGSTVMSSWKGTWFRARLTVRATPRTRDEGSLSRTNPRPQLLFGVRDSEGDPLQDANGVCALRPNTRVEVDSRELGRAEWEVAGDAEPLRKKRRLIGWQVDVIRVEAREFAPV